KFFDSYDVNEFQLVAWNAETFVIETQETTGRSFEDYHHSFIYQRFKEMYEEKIARLLSWTKDGHLFVIFPYSFGLGPQTDGKNGIIRVDINQFPPFNLVKLTPASCESIEAAEEFVDQFSRFVDILKCDVVLSGDDIVPLFRTGGGGRDGSEIVGAA